MATPPIAARPAKPFVGPATVSARLVAGIVGVAAARGVDVAAALAAAGIDAALLEDPVARIPIEQEEALWEEFARRTGDACFGLHAQLHMPAGAVDVLDFVVRSSETLGDAFQNLIRFNRLAHDLAEFELRIEGSEARLVQSSEPTARASAGRSRTTAWAASSS